MAGLIKNQILKHLSKFTKNLSPDKIHVSTLRGEGELSALELDEQVLTQVLDLPTWLRISKATCNRVAIKIQWTKLKSQPICLYLDEIEVQMETCDVVRSPASGSPLSDLSGPGGKYGLVEKIVDGMYISINSVLVNFTAPKFRASIQMSRIVIQSKTPTWESASDLRLTRIKDELRGQVLVFKEAEWQTLRIEANALASEGAEQLTTTPLRLIANQSKIRITMKKRLSDCGIIASRLLVSLDDLLWVLTDSQLKAALLFINSLKEIVTESSRQAKLLAAEKIKKQGFQPSSAPGHTNQKGQNQGQNQRTGSKSQQAIAKLFDKYSIHETSYHLHTTRVDLHLCDDSIPEDETHRRKVEGGALQLTLYKLCFDFYPFHPAGADRSHWLRFDENMASRHAWAQGLLDKFREDVGKVRSVLSSSRLNSPTHNNPASGHVAAPPRRSSAVQNHKGQAAAAPQQHAQAFQAAKHTQLLENSFILRLEDLVIYQVSSSSAANKHAVPRKLLSSDKKALCLPPEMSSIHMEYTDYYFPDGIDFPDVSRRGTRQQVDGLLKELYYMCDDPCMRFVPSSNIFMVVNPVKLQCDYTTLLWLNAFLLNMQKTVELPQPEGPMFHTDIRIEALMPRVVLPAENEVPDQIERPNGLQIQVSRVTISNCREGSKVTLDDLKQAVLQLDKAHLFHQAPPLSFPRAAAELHPFPDCILDHLLSKDSPYHDKTIEEVLLTASIPKSLSQYNLAEILRETRDDWEVLSKPEAADKTSNMKKSGTVDSVSSVGLTYYSMRTDSLKKLADKDVWCVAIDQFWMELIGAPISRNRPQPFVESFPITLWIFRPKEMQPFKESASMETLREFTPTTNMQQQLKSIQSLDCNGMIESCQSNSDQLSESTNTLKGDRNDNVPNGNASDVNSDTNQTLCDNHKQASQGSSVIASAAANIDPRALGDNQGQGVGERSYTPQVHGNKAEYLDRSGNDGISSITNCEQNKSSDIHILVKIGGKVNVQLGHYQFLFIMRLVESLTNMQNEIKDDRRFITGKPLPQTSIGLSVTVNEAELALVCPPIADLPSPETSIDESSDLTLDDTMVDEDKLTEAIFDSMAPSYEDSVLGTSNTTEHSLDPAVVFTKCHSDTEIPSHSPLTTGEASLATGREESSETELPGTQFSSNSSLSVNVPSQSAASTPQLGRRKASSQSLISEGYASMGTSPKRDRKPVDLKKSLNSGFSSFSRGFGKFTDKMKNINRHEDEDEEWETQSTRSSDEEDLGLLLKFENREELPAFDKHYADLASEDEAASLINVATGEGKLKGVVSIATFRVECVEALVQVDGDNTVVGATVGRLVPEELGNVLLDKFQERFATDIKEQEDGVAPVESPPMKLRFEQGPRAERFSSAAKDRGYLRLEVSGLHSTLGIASLTGLADLVEDEKHGPVMPLCVDVSDSFITLQDSRPPTNETSPGKVPMDLHVSRVVLTRTEDGVFHVLGDTLAGDLTPDDKYVRQQAVQTTPSIENPPTASRVVIENSPSRPLVISDQPDLLGAVRGREGGEDIGKLQERVSTLQGENDLLRRQLERIGKMSSETGGIDHDSLQSLQEECEQLRKRCKKLDQVRGEHRTLLQETARQADEIQGLQSERASLLATIQMLQEELMDSEDMRARQSAKLARP